MRILELAPYSYFKGNKGFEKNNSGFAYAVSDICEALAGRGNEVFLLTQSAITKGFSYKCISILRKEWSDVLLNFKFSDVNYGLKALKGTNITFIEKLKTIYYFINRGYTEKVIREIDPDVIHIQSISNYTIPFMMAAANCGKPFIVSNHGLAAFLEDSDPRIKKLEEDFLKVAEKNNTVITAVSSGIKNRVIDFYQLSGNNIEVVFNGYRSNNTDAIDVEKLNSLKAKYGIKAGMFVFLCAGSVSYRKNQLQVVRAFSMLLQVKKRAKLLLAGYGPQYDELREYVTEKKLENDVVVLGNVEHDEMAYYYTLSNCTVMASVDEGFGLPIIEGYSFGIPSIMYRDLDAALDISFPETGILVEQRSDASLSQAMASVMDSEWDEYTIKKYAIRFSNKVMGEKYHRVLKNGIKSNSSIPFEQIAGLLKERK